MVPAITTNRETAPSFMERGMAVHTVTSAKEDMDGTVVKSDSKATYYKPQPPSKSVVKTLSYKKSKIKGALSDLSVVTKPMLRR